MILYKLRSLEAPDLTIVPPEELSLVMEVLIEIEFIYQNLHIVIDKILEIVINEFVKQFTDYAR